jgi:Ogr/Delta-like zinc finger
MRMRCPHCKDYARVRSSEEITSISRESYFSCTNTECGHTFVAITEIHRTLSPSAIPDPAVRLPRSAHVRRRELAEQLKSLPVATAFTPGPVRCT